MKYQLRSRMRRLALCLLAQVLFFTWAVVPSVCLAAGSVRLDDMVKRSDNIFVAVCSRKATSFREGHVVTNYKLKPLEVWKGTMSLDSEGNVSMDELGGVLNGPVPFGEAISGVTPMVPGEQVVLFTRAFHVNPATSPEGAVPAIHEGSPIPVSSRTGRLSVLTHPVTKQQHIVIPNPSSQGVIGSDAATQRFLNLKMKALQKSTAAAKDTVQADKAATRNIVTDLQTLDSLRERVKELVQTSR